MKIEYFLFNIIIIAGPLLLALSNWRWVIRPNPRALMYAVFISAVFFILWDQLVTGYFWSFNPRYISGFLIGKIPIEEVLFFITVPISCTFLWVNVRAKVKETHISMMPILCGIFILCITSYFSMIALKIYTAAVCLALCGTILLDAILQTRLWTKKSFIIFILVIVNVFTFIFNAYLTARPIVIYNALMKTNSMLFTIPIEDFIYGMSLIAFTVILYEAVCTLQKKE